MKLVKLLVTAVVAWALGLAFIALLILINRKMSLSEAIGFIVTFLIIGSVFGLGFTLVYKQSDCVRSHRLMSE